MNKAVHHTLGSLIFILVCVPALAADVNLNGIIGTKALLVIDGAKPRWLSAGETSPEGIKLMSIGADSAVFELSGQRQTIKLGQSERLAVGTAASPSAGKSVTLIADGRGHFVTTGQINGSSVRFLVDTGASYISLASGEAKRLGISYLEGQRASMSTANGVVPT